MWDFLKYLLLLLTFLVPLLWLTSSLVRYYVRVTFYYLMLLSSASVVCVWGLPDFGDCKNYKLVQRAFGFLGRPFRVKWEQRDMHYLESESSYVLVCNHQSSLDLLGMIQCWPERCVALIKRELAYAGTFGLAALMCGSVFIDRFNKDTARQVMAKTADYVTKNNLKLWVFPEGTRNHDGEMLPFKKGAFHLAVQAQIPIVPVVFSSFKPFYSKTEKRFLSDGFAIIKALKPIPTKGLSSNEDVTRLSEQAREVMMTCFKEISAEAAQRYANRDF